MPMPLYNSPDEILDWADWLVTVCVSSEDRKHIDLCVGGRISKPEKKNATNIREGVMRGIQIRERERELERERERNIRESILRESKKKIECEKLSEVSTLDKDEDEDGEDDNDDDAEDIEGGDDDEDDEDESEEDDEDEEEEEEDEDYAGRHSRTPDALPSRSSSRKRKAAFD